MKSGCVVFVAFLLVEIDQTESSACRLFSYSSIHVQISMEKKHYSTIEALKKRNQSLLCAQRMFWMGFGMPQTRVHSCLTRKNNIEKILCVCSSVIILIRFFNTKSPKTSLLDILPITNCSILSYYLVSMGSQFPLLPFLFRGRFLSLLVSMYSFFEHQ